jgi:guanylate kinase
MPEDVVGIFLLPPSIAELERRLRARGTDSEEEIIRRMAKARDDASHWREFDHVLINTDFAETVDTVSAILRAARTARSRNPWLGDFVAGMG